MVTDETATGTRVKTIRLGWTLVLGGLLCLAPVLRELFNPDARRFASAVALAISGIFALGVGVDYIRGLSPSFRRVPRPSAFAWLCLIICIAIVFRVWTFGIFPPPDGFSSVEETQRATGAFHILEHGRLPWEWPLPQYLTAASFRIFGYSMEALRGAAILLGVLTIPAYFFFLLEWTTVPAALFAAGLLAVSRWHVQVSWYMEDVYAPLFVFVVIFLLASRTLRDPRSLWFVLLGALCAYTLYDYAAFRITPALLLLFLRPALEDFGREQVGFDFGPPRFHHRLHPSGAHYP